MKPSPESFERKLFIPRNVEGEQNQKELEVIRTLEERLKDHPAFVGLAPGGSVMRGYSNEFSDIDIWVIFDPSKVPPDDHERINKGGSNIFRDFRERGVHFFFISLSPKALDLGSHVSAKNTTDFGHEIPDILATMTGIVTGKKIDRYRAQIREELQQLTSAQREALKQQALDTLKERDRMSMKKLTKRIPEAEPHSEDIFEARKRLWENRWERIWEKADQGTPNEEQ